MTSVRLTKTRALAKLSEQLHVIPSLRHLGRRSSDFTKWHRDTRVALERIFGSESQAVRDFKAISFSLMVATPRTTDAAWEQAFQNGLNQAEPVLQSLISEIEEYEQDDVAGQENTASAPPTAARDLPRRILPAVEQALEDGILESQPAPVADSFKELLHPRVSEHSLPQFEAGQLRDAVLNAFIAVFDLIRERTGLDADGVSLVGQALSLGAPRLILSELHTQSGKNDQKGFLQIFEGAYTGIRNPKAHTLSHDLTPLAASQYLVFASLLARRIDQATLAP